MLTATAPAKLNLTLEVLGRRDDGYHEIRSVVQAIDLGDRLTFEATGATEVSCTMPGWNAEESLVMRAVDVVSEATGSDRGVTIEIEKRIPLMSGLGGDSSDAAAVLLALDRLWQLGLSPEKLHELAARLGSDVPFFLGGGTALMAGRGERLTPLPSPAATWAVVVVPPVPRGPGKTAHAYGRLEASDFTGGEQTERLAATLRSGGSLAGEPLFNAFERSAFAEVNRLVECRDAMLAASGTEGSAVHLAGSGPGLFAVVADRPAAEALCSDLKRRGLRAYLTATRDRGVVLE
ncbi:MAG: 4-(cytidine 5'-diphospho)-2-C-methyl-D-erythritol kinase [Dehalococcoidales bacterium]